jgi:hypothetical protein
MSLLSAPILLSVTSSKIIGFASGTIGLAGLVAFAVLYSATALVDRLSGCGARLGTAALSSGAWTVARQPRTLVFVLAHSTPMRGTIVLISIIFGSLLDRSIQGCVYLVLVPPMILVSRQPVAVAGPGVREGVFVADFSAFGVIAKQVLSVAGGGSTLVAGVFGGAHWRSLGLMPNSSRPEYSESGG